MRALDVPLLEAAEQQRAQRIAELEVQRHNKFQVRETVEEDQIPEHLKLELAEWNGKYEDCIFADKRKHGAGVLRSRIAARQYANHPEEGLFAATPDEAVTNYLLSDLARNKEKAMLIWDCTSAFLHLPLKVLGVGCGAAAGWS